MTSVNEMAENVLENLRTESMASPLALKAAKKELRTSMKQKLSKLTTDSISDQSRYSDMTLCYYH